MPTEVPIASSTGGMMLSMPSYAQWTLSLVVTRLVPRQVHWITFHSGYDFGYLLKILTCQNLPAVEPEFFELLRVSCDSPSACAGGVANIHYQNFIDALQSTPVLFCPSHLQLQLILREVDKIDSQDVYTCVWATTLRSVACLNGIAVSSS